MTRTVKLTGLAAVLVAAFLLGAVALNTASAEVTLTPTFPPPPSWELRPAGGPERRAQPDGSFTDCARVRPAKDAPAAGGDGGVQLGDLDALACSLADGCEIPVAIITEDGEVLKLMVITFEDPEPESTATTTPAP